MSSIYKYINVDSTYRNRKLYPNPADFVMPVSYTGNLLSDPFQAADPIIDAYPTEIAFTQAGSTDIDIVLSATSSTIQNFYINKYLQIGNEYRIITNYDPATKIATVSVAFSAAPAALTKYYIRGGLPTFSGTVGATGNTFANVNLGLTASSSSGTYRGQYLSMTSGTADTETSLIVSYSGDTKIAGITPSFSSEPVAGDTFDILGFSRDNFAPLTYWGTRGFNNPVCYSMELLYLMVPNQILKSGYGGTLDKYPYFILKVSNVEMQYSDHILYSNNPNERNAMFRVPMPLTLRSESFFILRDSKCIEVVKFKPDQSLKFQLLLPSGQPIIFKTDDNVSPEAPNPFLQISASFAIRRIVPDE